MPLNSFRAARQTANDPDVQVVPLATFSAKPVSLTSRLICNVLNSRPQVSIYPYGDLVLAVHEMAGLDVVPSTDASHGYLSGCDA